MYILELTETFSAAHALRDYPGVCARIHGHNWKLKVALHTDAKDRQGITLDYAVLKKMVEQIAGEFDHDFLNEHPHFRSVNPTSENLAEYVYGCLEKELPPEVRLDHVQIWETDNFSVIFRK
jgi:6-pyruvoyltetrahydropterin/6-carboxytetrahydropterin synthase